MIWEAPAKVNLSLEVRSRTREGMHPLRSLVQTIGWCDVLEFEEDDEDHLDVAGGDLPDDGDNLVWKALTALRGHLGDNQPRLHINLKKVIPVAAGLGGGSSNGAASMLALADLRRIPLSTVEEVAPAVGADVLFFLAGGTAWMEGYGEKITETRVDTESWALGVAVPDFELRTEEVYEVWDRLDEPAGPGLVGRILPPSLRELGPFRNDLTPAALELRPDLGDWIEELTEIWERPVAMSGSGPALFGFFADLDEAEGAVGALPASFRASQAVQPRRVGVLRVS